MGTAGHGDGFRGEGTVVFVSFVLRCKHKLFNLICLLACQKCSSVEGLCSDSFEMDLLTCDLDVVSISSIKLEDICVGSTLILSPAADASTRLRVLMWNHCVFLVPGSLVLPISASHHDRIVRELRIQTSSAPSFSCDRSSSCTPRLFSAVYRPSDPACCCCSISNHWPCTVPRRCRSSLEDRRERDKQVDNRDADVRVSDPEATSSISSYPSEDHYRATDPPAVEQRSKHHRPPWRYWRRTGSEPQHKQPGGKHTEPTSPSLKDKSNN